MDGDIDPGRKVEKDITPSRLNNNSINKGTMRKGNCRYMAGAGGGGLAIRKLHYAPWIPS